jgi:Tfp pilus assembly protein PilO
MPGKHGERWLIIAVLACLGVLVADRLVLTPLTHLWQARAKRVVELRQSVEKGTQLLDREQALDERWQDMRARSMPREMSMTQERVFSSVNNWAQSSGLTVTSLKPRRIPDEEDCRKLEIRLSATGSLIAIARFIYAFETDKQAHKIEDMDLTARDDKGRQLTLNLRFTALVIQESDQSSQRTDRLAQGQNQAPEEKTP